MEIAILYWIGVSRCDFILDIVFRLNTEWLMICCELPCVDYKRSELRK